MTPRLFITPDGPVSTNRTAESCSSSIITLAHPKTGNFLENYVDLGVSTRYLVQGSQIHSIMRISTPHLKRSVFVGDSVISGSQLKQLSDNRWYGVCGNSPRHTLSHPPTSSKTHFSTFPSITRYPRLSPRSSININSYNTNTCHLRLYRIIKFVHTGYV